MTPFTLMVTSPSLYATGRTRRALREALPSAVVRGAGFRAIFVVEAQGDSIETAERIQRECARSIGKVTAVLAQVPSVTKPVRDAAVAVARKHVGANESFCFRLRKRGTHELEQATPELESAIGAAIWTALYGRHGKRPRVDLGSPDVTIAAEVLGPTTAVGLRRKAWRCDDTSSEPDDPPLENESQLLTVFEKRADGTRETRVCPVLYVALRGEYAKTEPA